MDRGMFDEIIDGLAALEAKIAAINARPLPLRDMKRAHAELKGRPAAAHKRIGKGRGPKAKA